MLPPGTAEALQGVAGEIVSAHDGDAFTALAMAPTAIRSAPPATSSRRQRPAVALVMLCASSAEALRNDLFVQ